MIHKFSIKICDRLLIIQISPGKFQGFLIFLDSLANVINLLLSQWQKVFKCQVEDFKIVISDK